MIFTAKWRKQVRGNSNLKQGAVRCNEKFDIQVRSGLENSGGVTDVWSPRVTQLIKQHFPGEIKCTELKLHPDDDLFAGGLNFFRPFILDQNL